MKTLYLPLKKEWYEMIEAGIKKEEQPENGVCVLIKVDDQLGNKTIYLGSREGTEYLTDGGLVFGTESDANSEVIGWREIHE